MTNIFKFSSKPSRFNVFYAKSSIDFKFHVLVLLYTYFVLVVFLPTESIAISLAKTGSHRDAFGFFDGEERGLSEERVFL